MPKFEAKKGDFAKIWQKLGATAPPSMFVLVLEKRVQIDQSL